MSFDLKIKFNDGTIQCSSFKTMEELTAFEKDAEEKKIYGEPGSTRQTAYRAEVDTAEHEVAIPAVLDENGNVVEEEKTQIIPATYKQVAYDVIVPCQYTKEIVEVKDPIKDISPRQIRLALLSVGVTEAAIDASIASLPSPTKDQAMIAWKYSTSFERNVPIIESIGTMLGLSAEQLDQLWIQGSQI